MAALEQRGTGMIVRMSRGSKPIMDRSRRGPYRPRSGRRPNAGVVLSWCGGTIRGGSAPTDPDHPPRSLIWRFCSLPKSSPRVMVRTASSSVKSPLPMWVLAAS